MSAHARSSKPPEHIARMLPEFEHTRTALLESLQALPAHTVLICAVWNMASVWPRRVERTYRFGPPAALAGVDKQFPFHWVYAGSTVFTAAWEAQFCANDVTRPGTFYIQREAAIGAVARMNFDRPLTLIDLTGDLASKLGIYDALANRDHAWCQWFGCQIDRVIAAQPDSIDGIRYISRKHPGHAAYAISSRAMERLDSGRITVIEHFTDTPEYLALQTDPCFVLPP